MEIMENTFEHGLNLIMNTYSRFPIVLEKGNGMYVTDENGKTYLDFVAGIAVNCLGHSNKKLIEAICRQSEMLIHCSNLYWNKPQISLAEKLIKNSCFDKVFFCNSGAEAVEGAIKLARKYGRKHYYNEKNEENEKNARYEIITMTHSFHGRTMGALTATGQEKYHKNFPPLLPGIKYVPYNDFDALCDAVSPNTCAILLEPIQGEGGIRPACVEYLQKVRQLCDKNDILLVYDEIQCGLGRTGRLFAYEYFNTEPDVAVIAKGLGGGVPIGAILAKKKADVFEPSEHASTFGGNPLATTAGNVVIDELINGLVENADKQGKYLTSKLIELKDKHDIITDIRGIGLIQGIETSVPVAPIISECIKNGLLLVGAGANVIRFVPALIVSESDIDKCISILSEVLLNFK